MNPKTSLATNNFHFNYLPALDGLRGVAVIAVIIFHATGGGLGKSFLNGGFIGVDIFFVLSGFLITSLLIDEHYCHKKIDLKKFYIRRVLRLLPALLLLLIVINSTSWLIWNPQKTKDIFIDSLISLFYIANWTRAFEMGRPEILGHTWSLSIEEQYYIIWPLFLIFFLKYCKNRNSLTMITILGLLASWFLRVYLFEHGASPMRLYNGLDTRADCLLTGCALASLMSSSTPRAFLSAPSFLQNNFRYIAISAALFLLVLAHKIVWWSPANYYWIFSAVEFCAALIVLDLFISPGSLLKGFFEQRILVWIGRLSYGLYLWHYPIYETMRLKNCSTLSIVTIGTILSIMAASASYYFIERPILKLKRNFRVV